VQPHAIALFTCPGAPMIHNGQEWGESYWFPEPGGDRRVESRPLRWGGLTSDLGKRLNWLYGTLAWIRANHPSLRSPNFYPGKDADWYPTPGANYGVDIANGTVVFQRWGDNGGATERFVIVLNYSSVPRGIHVSFPVNGKWKDVLNGGEIDVGNLHWYMVVESNWGKVLRLT